MTADELAIFERIAVALEKLADSLPATTPKPNTPFPWDRVSARCRNALSEAVHANTFGDFTGHVWPLTCEALFAIGSHGLRDTRHFGAKCNAEIEAILDELGFPNWKHT